MKALQMRNGQLALADGKLRSLIAFRRDWTGLPATLHELGQREYPGKAVLTVGRS